MSAPETIIDDVRGLPRGEVMLIARIYERERGQEPDIQEQRNERWVDELQGLDPEARKAALSQRRLERSVEQAMPNAQAKPAQDKSALEAVEDAACELHQRLGELSPSAMKGLRVRAGALGQSDRFNDGMDFLLELMMGASRNAAAEIPGGSPGRETSAFTKLIQRLAGMLSERGRLVNSSKNGDLCHLADLILAQAGESRKGLPNRIAKTLSRAVTE